MEIVKAIQQDIDTVIALVKSCIAHMQTQGIDQWDELYPDRATIEHDCTAGNLYLAIDQCICRGAIVIDENQEPGYETIDWQYHGSKIVVVHRLAINPQYQGQGLASRLMDFAECYARTRQAHAIRLAAFRQNPNAMRLYVKRKYRMAGMVTFRKGVFSCFEKQINTPDEKE